VNDLATQYPEKVRELVSKYEAWEKKVGTINWEFFLKCGGFHGWVTTAKLVAEPGSVFIQENLTC